MQNKDIKIKIYFTASLEYGMKSKVWKKISDTLIFGVI